VPRESQEPLDLKDLPDQQAERAPLDQLVHKDRKVCQVSRALQDQLDHKDLKESVDHKDLLVQEVQVEQQD
jgi:hypothetical protein